MKITKIQWHKNKDIPYRDNISKQDNKLILNTPWQKNSDNYKKGN